MERPHLHMGQAVYLLPNLFTTLNLLCGFYAIVVMIQSLTTPLVRFSHAGAAILLGAVFDSLDGRIARLMKSHSKFGEQYDSLADVTTFCLAPALLVYTWSLYTFDRFGWVSVFLFFACGALRLARFNANAGTRHSHDFQGLPTPAAAGLITATVLLHNDVDTVSRGEKLHMLVLLYLTAGLMVSNVTYPSFKGFDLRRPLSFGVLVGLLVAVVLIVLDPITTLFVVFAGYTALGLLLLFLPASVRHAFRRLWQNTFGSEPRRRPRRRRRFTRRPDAVVQTPVP